MAWNENYIYLYSCVHIFTYIHKSVCIHTHMFISLNIFIYQKCIKCIYIYIHISTYFEVSMQFGFWRRQNAWNENYKHSYSCVHIFTYVHKSVYNHTHMFICLHIFIFQKCIECIYSHIHIFISRLFGPVQAIRVLAALDGVVSKAWEPRVRASFTRCVAVCCSVSCSVSCSVDSCWFTRLHCIAVCYRVLQCVSRVQIFLMYALSSTLPQFHLCSDFSSLEFYGYFGTFCFICLPVLLSFRGT